MRPSWTHEFHAGSTARHVGTEATGALESGHESQWTDVLHFKAAAAAPPFYRTLPSTWVPDRVASQRVSRSAGILEPLQTLQKDQTPPTRQNFSMFYANITSWSPHVQEYFQDSRFHAILLTEHRQTDTESLEHLLSNAGFHVACHAAVHKNGGPSCGIALASKKYLGGRSQPVGNSRWLSKIIRFKGFDLTIMVAYFPCDGVHAPEHKTMQIEIGSYIMSLTGPWVLVADFNCDPAEFMATGWPRIVGGQIVHTSEPTIATGSIIDYAVVSNTLTGTLNIQPEIKVPWKPHYGLTLTFNMQALVAQIPTLRQVTVPLQPGPRPPWHSFDSSTNERGLDAGYAQWCAQGGEIS